MREAKNPLGATGRVLAENVVRLRTAQGLSYAETERRLTELGRRIPVLGLAHIERGQRRVDADDLVALAVVLGVTPNALLLPHDEPKTPAADLVTAAGETTVGQVWDWAERWAPLPSQLPAAVEVDPELTGAARGRAEAARRAPQWAAEAFWERSAPPIADGGPGRSLDVLLREVRERVVREPGEGVRVWSEDGHQVTRYPRPGTRYASPDADSFYRLREHVLAILSSPEVELLAPGILKRVQARLDERPAE